MPSLWKIDFHLKLTSLKILLISKHALINADNLFKIRQLVVVNKEMNNSFLSSVLRFGSISMISLRNFSRTMSKSISFLWGVIVKKNWRTTGYRTAFFSMRSLSLICWWHIFTYVASPWSHPSFFKTFMKIRNRYGTYDLGHSGSGIVKFGETKPILSPWRAMSGY